jgi:hypothetical protein
MKKAKEILEMVEGRLSSPLIFSFLISWLITNWEITLIILFGVDSAPLVDGEKQSLIAAVHSRLSWPNAFCWPFFFALVYTFANPFVQSWISSFYTWLTRNTENRNLKIIGEKGLIKAQKYIDTKAELYDQYEKIKKITEEENEKQAKYLKLQGENQNNEIAVNDLNKQLRQKNEEIRILERLSSPQFMEGFWNISMKDNREDIVFESLQVFIFTDGEIDYINNSGSRDRVAKLEYIFFNRSQKLLTFLLVINREETVPVKNFKNFFNQKAVFFELIQQGDIDCFEGTQNRLGHVTWKRAFEWD